MYTLQKLSLALVGTAAMLMSANPASAVNLVQGGATSVPGEGQKTNIQGAITIDFNDGKVPTSGLVTFSGVTPGVANGTKITGSSIVNGSLNSVYATPLNDTSNYLAVSVGNDVTINFAQALDYFGFYWGSIDKYNYVDIYSKGVKIQTFNGSNVPGTKASGSQVNAVDNIYVNLLAGTGETFDKIVLRTTSPALETDNYSYRVATVPEPSSMLGLLAFGALSAGSLVKRKSKIA
ncbi:PEP-CTERM sorting domain-containing protein [Nostoc linckia FACHB-104]|nr:PEP-CTERM sorting domain-containing protein [Nostoc linckia FACHB-104]